jgi:hypothetical protein
MWISRASAGCALALMFVMASPEATAQSAPCAIKPGTSDGQNRQGLCGFNSARRVFAGSPAAQAQCLLQTPKVALRGLSNTVVPLELLSRVGTSTQPTIAQVRKYLSDHHIAEADVGGPIAISIGADYFVIHDTSTPNCSEGNACSVLGKFPPDINSADWPDNQNFNHHRPPNAGKRRAAHIMINRVGDSITETDLKDHISHVKFDYCIDKPSKKGLFVGVENIQPRIGEPAIARNGTPPNDFIAPTPGFSDAQYERLALTYIVASARRGRWLVPAYHAVLDWYFIGGHDDPQNFDLRRFSADVSAITVATRSL